VLDIEDDLKEIFLANFEDDVGDGGGDEYFLCKDEGRAECGDKKISSLFL
jgi:hypothetical protein